MVYLDHAAATPVSDKALSAMLPYFDNLFFNPSAPYLPAKRVREDYEAAKSTIAHVIGAKGADLIITAGATESINLAFTVCRPYLKSTDNRQANPKTTTAKHLNIANIPNAGSSTHLPQSSDSQPPRILTIPTEHAAVLESAKPFGAIFASVDSAGLVDLADFRAKLSPDIVLVTISLANNELGTIQPLSELAEIIRTERQNRLAKGNTTPLYFHTDASQAANLIDINVARLGVDLLTLNAAKCGGPKGVGALYFAHGIKIQPLSVGGGQERGLRSGTENVPGVIGFAVAIDEAKKHLAGNRKKYQKMAQILHQAIKNLPEAHSDASIVAQNNKNVNHNLNSPIKSSEVSFKQQIPEPIFLGNPKHQLANFVPVCFPGLDAERVIYKLESEGILVSTGAACAANKGNKSHVLAAIGLSDAEIAGSLRISLGSTNTEEQIFTIAPKIVEIIKSEYIRVAERLSK